MTRSESFFPCRSHARVSLAALSLIFGVVGCDSAAGGASSTGSNAPKINLAGCAGKGAWLNKCGANTVTDGSLRLVVDSDLDGSGQGRPKPTSDGVQGKACEVTAKGGVITLVAGSVKATAQAAGRPDDQIMGNETGGGLFIKDAEGGVTLQYDATMVVSGVQVNAGRRTITCLPKS